MKSNRTITIMAIAAAAGTGLNSMRADEKSQAKLEAKAKVTKVEAQKTAMSKAQRGTVKEAELEEEKGKLVWSFDIATPGTTDITEVQVDAVTGKIVSVQIEKAKDEAREAKNEKEEKDKAPKK